MHNIYEQAFPTLRHLPFLLAMPVINQQCPRSFLNMRFEYADLKLCNLGFTISYTYNTLYYTVTGCWGDGKQAFTYPNEELTLTKEWIPLKPNLVN